MYKIKDVITNGEHLNINGKVLVLRESEIYKNISKSYEINTIIKKDNLIYEFIYNTINSETTVIIYTKFN